MKDESEREEQFLIRIRNAVKEEEEREDIVPDPDPQRC
jgi:hypothetical protein